MKTSYWCTLFTAEQQRYIKNSSVTLETSGWISRWNITEFYTCGTFCKTVVHHDAQVWFQLTALKISSSNYYVQFYNRSPLETLSGTRRPTLGTTNQGQMPLKALDNIEALNGSGAKWLMVLWGMLMMLMRTKLAFHWRRTLRELKVLSGDWLDDWEHESSWVGETLVRRSSLQNSVWMTSIIVISWSQISGASALHVHCVTDHFPERPSIQPNVKALYMLVSQLLKTRAQQQKINLQQF